MTSPSPPWSTAELARVELENSLELWGRSMPFYRDGASGRDGSVAWVASGLPVAFFNQVVSVGDGIDGPALERAVAAIRDRRVPFIVRIRLGQDDAAAPVLERLGLVEALDEALPGMAMWPIPEPADWPAPPPELEIRSAVDGDGLSDHLDVMAAAFGLSAALARELIPIQALDDPGTAVLTGYLAGRPVTSAMAFSHDRVVGVYNVGTVDDARRRGIGAALTRHAIADGVRRGAEVAILQASPMGRGLYEAMGFREVVRYRVFREAERDSAAAPAARR